MTTSARKRKTSDAIIELMSRYRDTVEHYEEMMDVKTRIPVENQAQHVRDATIEGLIGRIEGANVMMENALHAAKCYAGFHYATRCDADWKQDWVGLDHPEFREWRRVYHTR